MTARTLRVAAQPSTAMPAPGTNAAAQRLVIRLPSAEAARPAS